MSSHEARGQTKPTFVTCSHDIHKYFVNINSMWVALLDKSRDFCNHDEPEMLFPPKKLGISRLAGMATKIQTGSSKNRDIVPPGRISRSTSSTLPTWHICLTHTTTEQRVAGFALLVAGHYRKQRNRNELQPFHPGFVMLHEKNSKNPFPPPSQWVGVTNY